MKIILKLVAEIVLLAALTGCVGYVDGGYGGGAVIEGPGPVVFDGGYYGGGYRGGYHGGYDRGVDVHAYSQRGFSSRAAAHPGGGSGRKW